MWTQRVSAGSLGLLSHGIPYLRAATPSNALPWAPAPLFVREPCFLLCRRAVERRCTGGDTGQGPGETASGPGGWLGVPIFPKRAWVPKLDCPQPRYGEQGSWYLTKPDL